MANLEKAAEITDQHGADVRTAKMIGSDLVARGAHCAVITMGRRGCAGRGPQRGRPCPGLRGGLGGPHRQRGRLRRRAGRLLCGQARLREAVKFAAAAGALVCTKFGAIEALPSKAEIIQLLQNEDIDLLHHSE